MKRVNRPQLKREGRALALVDAAVRPALAFLCQGVCPSAPSLKAWERSTVTILF